MLSLNLEVKGRKKTHENVFKGIPLEFELFQIFLFTIQTGFHCIAKIKSLGPSGVNKSTEIKEFPNFNLSETVSYWGVI